MSLTLTREGIAAALFSQITTAIGFQIFNRRVRHWTEVPPEQCPAFFLSIGNQRAQQDPNGNPPLWTYEYAGDLYVHSEDPNVAPGTLLNNYLDAIEAAIRPVLVGAPGFPGSVQVLGDTTQRLRHCWIVDIETDEGALGPLATAIIRFEVLLA
jgi:hypothetical protein